MYKQKVYPIVVIFLIVSCVFLPITSMSSFSYEEPNFSDRSKNTKHWTMMLYFCADTREKEVIGIDNSLNDLGGVMIQTLYQMPVELIPGLEQYYDIIALLDFPYSQSYPSGWANVFQVLPGGLALLEELEPTNLGSGDTLEWFIDYCKTNYPANNYALTLCDHGRGYAGFCYDYHAPHPYWEYALGDCLTVEEIETALGNTGGVDVLFLDTCLGGSFEVAWQFEGEVDYMVAGETIENGAAMYHSRDIVCNLSKNPNISPYELAKIGFDATTDPKLYSGQVYKRWKASGLYYIEGLTSAYGQNLKTIFDEFSFELYKEVDHNYTKAYETFGKIRDEITLKEHLFSAPSMMVDLYGFVEKVLEYSDYMEFNETIVPLANQLLGLLVVDPAGILQDEFHPDHYEGLYGFNICFPDSYDLCQGYLYPNFYDELDISYQTYWNDFFFKLFMPFKYLVFEPREFYEIYLNPIDPVVSLHVFYEVDPLRDPLHVGLNDDFMDNGMGIEIGIPGAEFLDDLLWGNSMIRIPASSIMSATKNGETSSFTVVINATGAASATQQVNLTVKHVNGTEVVWSENQISDFEVGQTLTCEVSTNDEMTDFEIEEPPTTTPPTTTEPPTTSSPLINSSTPSTTRTGFIGPAFALLFSSSLLTATVIAFVIYRKKKKV